MATVAREQGTDLIEDLPRGSFVEDRRRLRMPRAAMPANVNAWRAEP